LVGQGKWSALICKTLKFYIKIKMEAERDCSVMVVQLGVGKIPNHPPWDLTRKTMSFSTIGLVVISNESMFPTGNRV
jgi:hypothetical protein